MYEVGSRNFFLLCRDHTENTMGDFRQTGTNRLSFELHIQTAARSDHAEDLCLKQKPGLLFLFPSPFPYQNTPSHNRLHRFILLYPPCHAISSSSLVSLQSKSRRNQSTIRLGATTARIYHNDNRDDDPCYGPPRIADSQQRDQQCSLLQFC